MKKIRLVFFFLIVWGMPQAVQAQNFFGDKLEKGYDALKIFDYFKAKEIFSKSLKKHAAGAAYGLSEIFLRTDNPFHNIDSAYKYILIAEKNFKQQSAKEKEDLAKLSVNKTSIENQKLTIVKSAFERVKTENSVTSVNGFIRMFTPTGDLKKEAISLRNKLAFNDAKKTNTARSYKYFIDIYPDAEEIADAKWLYDFSLFASASKPNSLEGYESFIKQFPKSPYHSQAEDSIFAFTTHEGTVDEYHDFIKYYPANRNVKKAWDNIYTLQTSDFSPEAIANFLKAYPDYPDKQRVNADLVRSKMSLYPVVVDGKWGFCDSTGKIQIPCLYEWADYFSEGVAVVNQHDKGGFINKMGSVIIPIIYDEVNAFRGGVSVVKIEKKLGVINKTGKQILPIEFDDMNLPATSTDTKIILALKEGMYFYFTLKGKQLTRVQSKSAGVFSYGRAYIIRDDKYGFINSSGEVVIPAAYDWAENFNMYGSARVSQKNKFGLIDTSGNLLLPCEYDRIEGISDSLMMVVLKKKFGFANLQGKLAIPLKFDYTSLLSASKGFVDGLAKAEIGNKRGLIDKTDKWIIPCEYEDIRRFSEGLCAVRRLGKWGYLDKNRKQKINFLYEYAWDFNNGLARIKQKGKAGFIDRKGTIVIVPDYDEATDFSDSVSIVTKEDKQGMLDTFGALLVPCEMDEIFYVQKGIFKLAKNGKIAYFNILSKKQFWTQAGF